MEWVDQLTNCFGSRLIGHFSASIRQIVYVESAGERNVLKDCQKLLHEVIRKSKQCQLENTVSNRSPSITSEIVRSSPPQVRRKMVIDRMPLGQKSFWRLSMKESIAIVRNSNHRNTPVVFLEIVENYIDRSSFKGSYCLQKSICTWRELAKRVERWIVQWLCKKQAKNSLSCQILRRNDPGSTNLPCTEGNWPILPSSIIPASRTCFHQRCSEKRLK